MKRLLTLSILPFLPLSFAQAQTASDLNEGSRITYDSVNDDYALLWWARSPKTYFIQQSEDLEVWNYVPVIEPGKDGVIEWGFTTAADRVFFRFAHTGIRTVDPWNDDFDSDGISNYLEVLLGMNPFVDEGAINTGADDDNDTVINGQDAAPSDDTVGQLNVNITFPANNSTLN
ncbi:MAG: hypothetical protein AAGJ81_10455 [Verrucomicrobiota bacterium]